MPFYDLPSRVIYHFSHTLLVKSKSTYMYYLQRGEDIESTATWRDVKELGNLINK